MALASITVAGNGSQSTWSIPFSYIVASDIQASVNAVPVAAGNIAVAGANVTITPTPANGSVVIIFRVTSTNPPRVSWASATDLNPSDLDTTLLQPLYAVEENTDTITTNNAQVAANTVGVSALDTRTLALEASTSLAVGFVEIINLRHTSGVHPNTWAALQAGFCPVPFDHVTSWLAPGWNRGSFASGVAHANSIVPAASGSGQYQITFGTGTTGTWLCELQIMESFGSTPNMAAGLAFYDSLTGNTPMTLSEGHASNISPTDIALSEQGRLAPIATPGFLDITAGDTFDLWLTPTSALNAVTAQQNSSINATSSGSDLSWSLQAKFTKWG